MANVTLAREYWHKAFEYYFDGESDRAIAAGVSLPTNRPAITEARARLKKDGASVAG